MNSMVVSIGLWLHIASVVLAIGGTAFVVFVLGPTLRNGVAPDAQNQVFAGIRARFFPIVWGSIAVILISGLAVAGPALNPRILFGSTYGWLLTLKITLALILFATALLITLPNPSLARFRERAPQYQRMIVSMALVIILIATVLRTMHS